MGEVNRQMLAEAGFMAGWLEDVAEGDTIMFEAPGAHDLVEVVVTVIRPSTSGPGMRRFIATASSGEQFHRALSPEYPVWILRRPEPSYGGVAVHRTCEDGPTCTDPEHLEVRR